MSSPPPQLGVIGWVEPTLTPLFAAWFLDLLETAPFRTLVLEVVAVRDGLTLATPPQPRCRRVRDPHHEAADVKHSLRHCKRLVDHDRI